MSQRRAVVIGAGVAGLASAGVLARHFDKVTILERDRLARPERPGLRQSLHAHVLLARGRCELERLFPGFDARIRARGALEIDMGRDFAVRRPGGWAPRESSFVPTLFASRSLIDTTLLSMIRELANVEIVDGASVAGLLVRREGARPRLRGVEYYRPGSAGDLVCSANLVVDTSGRGSHAPDWLRRAGLQAPTETRIESLTACSTCWFEAPPPDRMPGNWWWKGIWIQPSALDRRTAASLLPVEGDRWVIALTRTDGQVPQSGSGFLSALDGLPSPVIGQAARIADPLSDIRVSRATSNRLRHYEAWKSAPAGFLALGDAACEVNPLCAQGMSAAAACAGLLADALADGLDPTSRRGARRFFGRQARFLRSVWKLATAADTGFGGAENSRRPQAVIAAPYTRALLRASRRNREVRRALERVANLLDPPATLASPRMLTLVLRHATPRATSAPLALSPEEWGATPTS